MKNLALIAAFILSTTAALADFTSTPPTDYEYAVLPLTAPAGSAPADQLRIYSAIQARRAAFTPPFACQTLYPYSKSAQIRAVVNYFGANPHYTVYAANLTNHGNSTYVFVKFLK